MVSRVSWQSGRAYITLVSALSTHRFPPDRRQLWHRGHVDSGVDVGVDFGVDVGVELPEFPVPWPRA